MKQNLHFIFVMLLLLINQAATSQQQTALFLESTSPTGVQESFYKQVSERNLVDNHIYTCGATLNNSGTYDILLSKYTLANVLVWTVTYTSTGNDNDYATDLTFDATGNIIICGAVEIGTLDYDAITLKYDASGTLLWSQTYAGAGNGPDALTCAVTDANNNVYVSGGTYASIAQLTNMLLIKYNSTGTQQWASTWNNGTYNMQDASFRILLSGNYANCYGATQTSASPVTWKLANAQFYQSNGNLNGSSTSYGDNEDFAEVKDIIVESNYYVTACGYSTASGQGKNLKVTKFNQTLASIWNYTYNNTSNHDDVANSIELYGSLLYVGGYTTLADGTKDIVVAKLNYNIGTASWLTTHDGGTGENDEAIDLATDGTGQLYLCGNSYKVGNSDYYVAKLKNTTGEVLAQNHFNGANNLDDIASNMVVTSTGDIYIAGQTGVSGASGNSYKYALTKWSEKTIYTPKPTDGFSSSGGYITNNKQLRNEDPEGAGGTGNTTVKYYNQNHRVATYIDDSKISYQLVQAMDSTNQDTTYRVDMSFTKGTTGAKVYPYSERKEYHNYYLGHMNHASERTSILNTIIKANAYNNTDIIYTHSPSGFRHWIVARTGAPTADFEMTFTGQNSLSVDGSGKLIIATSIGNITYTKAKAYSMNNTTGVQTLLTWQPSYVLSGSAVSFSGFGSWSGTLVLEFGEVAASVASTPEGNMNLEWSTYFRGNGSTVVSEIGGDAENNTYIVGATQSTMFQEIPGFNSNSNLSIYTDAFMVAFNVDTEPMYYAYYGGSNHDRFISLTLVQDRFFVGGYVQSQDVPSFSDTGLDLPYNGLLAGVFIEFDNVGEIVMDSFIASTDQASIADMDGYYNGATATTNIYLVGLAGFEDFPIVSNGSNDFSWERMGLASSYIMRIKIAGDNAEIDWASCLNYNSDNIKVATMGGNAVVIGVGQVATTEVGCDEPEEELIFPICQTPNSYQGDTSPELGTATPTVMIFNADNELFYSAILPKGWITDVDGYGTGIGFEDPSNFVIGGELLSSSVDEFPYTNNGYTQPSCSAYSQAFVMKFYISGNTVALTYASTIGHGTNISVVESVAIDVYGNIYFGGHSFDIAAIQQANEECTEAECDEMPICNASSLAYVENEYLAQTSADYRAFLGMINYEHQLIWSTLFGDGPMNTVSHMQTNNDKLWIAGACNYSMGLQGTWTQWQYDEEVTSDYYIPFLDPETSSAAISRFDITSIAGFVSTEEVSAASVFLNIYPNPTFDNIWIELPQQAVQSNSIITLYDAQGKLCTQLRVSNTRNVIVSAADLGSGLYTLMLSFGDSIQTTKFIKQ